MQNSSQVLKTLSLETNAGENCLDKKLIYMP